MFALLHYINITRSISTCHIYSKGRVPAAAWHSTRRTENPQQMFRALLQPSSCPLCLPKLRSRSRQSWAGSFPVPPRARQGRGARSRPHLSAPYLNSPQMHSPPATILRAAAPPSAGSALRLGAGPTRHYLSLIGSRRRWTAGIGMSGNKNGREQGVGVAPSEGAG